MRIHAATASRARRRELLPQYGLLLLAMALAFAFAVHSVQHMDESGWQKVFVTAAHRFVAREPFEPAEGYAYPPAMAVLSVPIAFLPQALSHIAWYLLNVVAGGVACISAWRLIGGPAWGGLQGRWLAVCWITVALMLRFFIGPYQNRQFDMVIAALLLGGCWRLAGGHERSGSVLLGGAAAMKCTPLLFAPYLAWRGKPAAAALIVAVALGVNVVPDLLWRQASGSLRLAEWCNAYLEPVARMPGEWDSSSLLLNQSLAGMLRRYVTLGFPLTERGLQAANDALDPHAAETSGFRWTVYGMCLALLVVTLLGLAPPWSSAPPRGTAARAGEPPERGRFALECGAVFCLMLLLSPMTSKDHYVVLVLPSLIVARAAIERRAGWLAVVLAGLFITGPLTAKDLIGKGLADLTLAWGMPTWFVVLELAALLHLLGLRAAPRLVQPRMPLSGSRLPPRDRRAARTGRNSSSRLAHAADTAA